MEDIGMSPDYRSGIDDLLWCSICSRSTPNYRLVDTCTYCGKDVCVDCSTTDRTTLTCNECDIEAIEEAKGRRTSAWGNTDQAKRQHRPILDIGDGAVLTSRLAT